MTYSTLIITLIVLFIASLIWMFMASQDENPVNRKLLRFCLVLFVVSTVIGMLGLLYIEPLDYLNTVTLTLAVAVAYGLYAWWYWYKRKLNEQDEVALGRVEIPQAVALSFFAAAALLNGLWATELPRYKTSEGVMTTVVPVVGVLVLPALVVLAHRYYNRIPVVHKFYNPWVLPLSNEEPVIEPTGDAKRIYFKIPLVENGADAVDIDINAPNEERLSSVFHYVLFKNRRDPRHHNVEVAMNKKMDFRYGWLLYRLEPRWWWFDKKVYLDLEGKVRFADVVDGETVFAERVRPWENKFL